MVGRDDQIIMLSLAEGRCGGSNRSHKREAIDAYLWVDDIDALYTELQQSMKEIEVCDLDGYVLWICPSSALARPSLIIDKDLGYPDANLHRLRARRLTPIICSGSIPLRAGRRYKARRK